MNNQQNINLKKCGEILSVPIFNDYEIIPSNDPQTILYAISPDKMFDEQLLVTSPLEKNETFKDRVKHAINTLNEKTKNSPQYCKGTKCFAYKDFNNGIFRFQTYIHDFVMKNDTNQTFLLRMAKAFFLEPQYNVVYRFSITVGPFLFPTEQIKLGKVDLKRDNVTKTLLTMFEDILSKIEYRK